jgi:propanol-preferring alcohol dehydrogenase
VEARGDDATEVQVGQRVGVAWLYQTDQTCPYCRRGEENLCVAPQFTGYDRDGGYAEYLVGRAGFVYPLPEEIDPVQFSPFLCAGIIGYRALKRSEVKPGQRLGLYGFGNSAHINIQVAQHGCETLRQHAMRRTRRWRGGWGDVGGRRERGAAGGSTPPSSRAGPLAPPIMEALDCGGTLAIADIYLTDIPSLNTSGTSSTRTLRSVTANTRQICRSC